MLSYETNKYFKPVSFFLTLAVIILTTSSCGGIRSGNFLKQKYLKGHLKPVPGDENAVSANQSVPAFTEDVVSESQTAEPAISEEESVNSEIGQAENNTHIESEKNSVNVSHAHWIKHEKKPTDPTRFKLPIKKIVSAFSARSKAKTALILGIILLFLTLIALPFAFLIGYWAILLSVCFFVAAFIILFSTDLNDVSNSFWVRFLSSLVVIGIMIGLMVLIAIAAAILLIWLIIWGIIQLIN